MPTLNAVGDRTRQTRVATRGFTGSRCTGIPGKIPPARFANSTRYTIVGFRCIAGSRTRKCTRATGCQDVSTLPHRLRAVGQRAPSPAILNLVAQKILLRVTWSPRRFDNESKNCRIPFLASPTLWLMPPETEQPSSHILIAVSSSASYRISICSVSSPFVLGILGHLSSHKSMPAAIART